jgi:hypothetical protein
MPCTALSMQHAACNMQHATCNMPCTACSMQHAICNMPCAARSERWSQKPTRCSELSQHRTVSRAAPLEYTARPHARTPVAYAAWHGGARCCSAMPTYIGVCTAEQRRSGAPSGGFLHSRVLYSRVLYCAGLIPCAIDQDPYFRMTRDVRTRQPPRGQVYVPGVLTSEGEGHDAQRGRGARPGSEPAQWPPFAAGVAALRLAMLQRYMWDRWPHGSSGGSPH